jgi:hypothetical protein
MLYSKEKSKYKSRSAFVGVDFRRALFYLKFQMARAHAAITAVFVCAFLCFVLVSAMDPMQIDPQVPLGPGSANALALGRHGAPHDPLPPPPHAPDSHGPLGPGSANASAVGRPGAPPEPPPPPHAGALAGGNNLPGYVVTTSIFH